MYNDYIYNNYIYIYINGRIKVFVTKHWIKKANTSIQCGKFMN